MSRNLLDLAKSLEGKIKSINIATSNVAVNVALGLETSLLNRTPVDTSKALSNWTVSVGAPIFFEREAYSLGYLGYTASQSIQAALDAAKAALARKKPGETIYIVNNAHYIRKLNNGSSKQAPAGFVEASVLIARRNIPKTIKL